MKRIIATLICSLILISCSDNNDNLLEDIAVRGGYAQFAETPNLSFNILTLDESMITAQIIDPNNNITNYSLSAIYEDRVAHDIIELTSFPANLELSLSTILEALEITEENVDLNSNITLVATITTPSGIYSGLSPDYDDNNVNQGGNTTVRLKATALNNAVEFNVSFFLPPARTIRTTSFEEIPVAGTESVYSRNGDENETLNLLNNENPPFVNFTSTGTSVENEIGFSSEFIAIPEISSSSLGFSEERIGVYSLLEDYEAYPDGNQGFHMEDVDGMIRITFETVDIPEGQEKSGLSFNAFFGDTTWESLDGMYAYVNVTKDSGSEVVELVNLFDDDIEAIAGTWQEFNTGFLTGVRSYQLIIEGYNGATAESIDIDNVIVYEPEN